MSILASWVSPKWVKSRERDRRKSERAKVSVDNGWVNCLDQYILSVNPCQVCNSSEAVACHSFFSVLQSPYNPDSRSKLNFPQSTSLRDLQTLAQRAHHPWPLEQSQSWWISLIRHQVMHLSSSHQYIVQGFRKKYFWWSIFTITSHFGYFLSHKVKWPN